MKRMLILLGLALLAACAPAPTATPIPPTVTNAPLDASSGALEALLGSGVPPDERPAWHSLPLTDVLTGTAFTLTSYAGKTIYVQPIAVGCAECLGQLEQVRAAKQRLMPDQYVFIALSADPADVLSAYATEHGFDWLFVSASPDLFADLLATYGADVTSLTNTPHFIISPLGAISNLSTGQHSGDQLIAELTAAAGA